MANTPWYDTPHNYLDHEAALRAAQELADREHRTVQVEVDNHGGYPRHYVVHTSSNQKFRSFGFSAGIVDPATSRAKFCQDENAGAFEAVYWGSHPDADNDDCWGSRAFSTLKEATEHAQDDRLDDSSVMWVEVVRVTDEVTGEGWRVLERVSLYRNQSYRPELPDQNDWLEEQAM